MRSVFRSFWLGGGLLFPVFAGFCKGVVRLHQLPQPFLEHMSVYLCGGNVGVTEQFLNDAQVRSMLQQVARERVAHDVR